MSKARVTPAKVRAARRKRATSPWFYHVTPGYNLQSIYRHGLLVAKARSEWKRVFVCKQAKVGWALKHVAQRHGVVIESLAVITVAVGANTLTRSRDRICYSEVDIPASALRQWTPTE